MGTVTSYPADWMGRPIGPKHTRKRIVGGEDASEVPDGPVAKVTEWVGYDPDRAKAALVKEHAKPDPRNTLISALEGVLKEKT